MIVSFFMLTLSVNQLRAYRHSQKTKMRELMHAYRLALEEMEECPVEETDMEDLGEFSQTIGIILNSSV